MLIIEGGNVDVKCAWPYVTQWRSWGDNWCFLFQYLLAFRRTLPVHHNHYQSFIRCLPFQPPALVQPFRSLLLVQVQRLHILCVASGQRLDAHHLHWSFWDANVNIGHGIWKNLFRRNKDWSFAISYLPYVHAGQIHSKIDKVLIDTEEDDKPNNLLLKPLH